MNSKIFLVSVFVFCVYFPVIPAQRCRAGSIWAKRGKNAKPVYSDDKANQIGDILTIIISENHKVDSKVMSNTKKETSRDLTLDGNLNRIDAGGVINKILPNTPSLTLDMSSNKSLKGKADYKDERKIEDRVTVVVEDIHANGNLVIIGTHSRDIGGDKQIIQVSGIVRPRDILFNNTVRSEQVANFNLVTINKGVTQDYNRPGWFARILDAVWPF